MLDGLMSGPILSKTNRIVGHYIEDSGFGQGRDSHGRSHVVGEDEEGCTVRNEARAVEGNSVAYGPHAMLTNAKSHVSFFGSATLEVAECFEKGHVGGGEVSTAS